MKTYEIYGYKDSKLMFVEGTVDETSVADMVAEFKSEGFTVEIKEQV